jgi:ubiquitin carboxyl-terminal hydrolase 8
MNFDKYKSKGLSGLANLGNTCFINSCVQILSHTYELNDFLDKETYKNKLNNKYDSALLIEWDNLRKTLWEKNETIVPVRFIKTIQRVAQLKRADLFTGFQQNDLPEFLLFLIDCFHTSLLREVEITIRGNPENETDKLAILCYEVIKKMYTKEYSEIWNLFYGIHVSQIVSLENEKILSQSPEPYFMMNLPIPSEKKSPTLYDCFDLYVNGETLEGDNAWWNEETKKKENVVKKMNIWSFPQIIILDFKRFHSHSNRKNQIHIDFPIENLNLSKYVIGYQKESYVYDLYGIGNHSGNVLGGHYTAFVKNANGQWYHFNDTSVEAVNDPTKIITPKAYCLFYRKREVK